MDDRTQPIPILATMTLAMKGNQERLLADGFDGYVAKSINIKEVATVIAQYLHRR